MEERIQASVIVCTYNRCESLRTTLASLAALNVPESISWELIVVDNNSTDGTREVVERFANQQSFPVIYLLERAQGLSFARNAGIAKARGEFVVFTDDDVLVEPGWLWRLVELFETSQCAAIGGKIVPSWTCRQPEWFTASGRFRLQGVIVSFDRGAETKRLDSAPFGANMAFRREVFGRYGGFRTDLGRSGRSLLGGEDSEFCSRLIGAGEQVMYAADAVVYHPVQPERMTKAYFQAWYFEFGRAAVKVEGIPEGTVCYWGIPRYLFRTCLSNALRWWLSAATARRFYYKVHAYMNVGTIVEAWQKHKGFGRQCC
jgi:glycosyltransferase involved in cell wall biosynthesis